MSHLLEDVLADLAATGDRLEAHVAGLDAAGWGTPTPAPGWTVAHQIAHLAWTDQAALAAATDPAAWEGLVASALASPDGFVDRAAETGAALAPADLLARWRGGRAQLAAALRAVPEGAKLPWFGPPMSAASMATARLMETWAHGLDVADALGVEDPPAGPTSGAIRHIAHLGVRTRDFAYATRGLTPPAAPFRIELTGPAGEEWTWGPEPGSVEGGTDVVRGPAYDFCLLVTQRRHRADLALEAVGADADAWLDIAQAFAGPPGEGRAPSGRA